MTMPFDRFFEDVWGYPPYPWQSELSRRVAATGWPSVLDIPTGSGKTAVLDVALHHLIVDGGRTAPRRMVLVVDRRAIVDQVAERARRLREGIESGATEVLAEARQALRKMVGAGAPLLECPVLRGGMLRDDSWAHFPHVPVVAASTVDQVGSRLLFRGYGVGARAWPLHAGLVGCDTLFFLDEVHLARPFAELLAQLDELRGGSAFPRRTGTVLLSATPGPSPGGGNVFRLTAADRETLARVLEAPKPATLDLVAVGVRSAETAKRTALAERAAKVAREMLAEGRRAVAVVVNRVDTARRVWHALGDRSGFDRVLLTGRMRPLDQEATFAAVHARIRAGRPTGAGEPPLVVVSTQCIEAGADFDFDGLVTECASLDALRQRFGRLDRRGEVVQRIGCGARAVILAQSDLPEDDPVYGGALKATWEWLQGCGSPGVDFGIMAMQPLLDDLPPDGIGRLLAPSKEAPVVLPAYLELWAQTNPAPYADPDVALFLHGIPESGRRAQADVRVVWRADVSERDLRLAHAEPNSGAAAALLERIAAVPPAGVESLALPVWTVRGWLARAEASDARDELSDAEGSSAEEVEPGSTLPVLVWEGPDDSAVRSAESIPPGATIVVPAEYGGLPEHGTFDPEASGAVEDLGDLAQLRQRGRPTLRVDERVWPEWGTARVNAVRTATEAEDADTRAEIAALLEEAAVAAPANGRERRFEELRRAVARGPRVLEFEASSDGGDGEVPRTRRVWVLLGRRAVEAAGQEYGCEVDGGGEDDESFLAQSTRLEPHCRRVGETAEAFGRLLHLPDALVSTLRWAGRLHDIGKAEPRFKAMLYGGDPVAASFGEALAKSPVAMPDMRARARARALAGYPAGQRHEMVSLDMIEASAELKGAVEADGGDWDLLLHLVASHHGWARPVAPVVRDQSVADSVEWTVEGMRLTGNTAHRRERLDSGVARRFYQLGRRFGWHEVAYLEAILRLADHRVSEGSVEP